MFSRMPLNCIPKEERIFSFLIVLMAWANVYELPGVPVGIGEILFLFFIPFYCKRGMNFNFKSYEFGFILWFVYATLVTLIFFNYFDAPINKFISIVRVAFYWILIFVFGKNLFNLDCFKKWMIVFSIALSGFIILQSVVYIFTGYFIPGFFLGAPLHDGSVMGYQMYEHSLYLAGFRGFIRPHGFLCESAHCCEFLSICMMTVVADFGMRFKNKLFIVLLNSVSMLLTLSSMGVVLLLFVWLIFICIEKRLSLFRWPIMIVVCLVVFAVFAGAIETGSNAVERLVAIINGEKIDGSSNARLNNGLFFYLALPFLFKLVGSGIGLFDYVVDSMNFGELSGRFINSFFGNLFTSGLFGTIIWNASLVIMFTKSNVLGKCLTSLFFLMSFGTNIFCQPQMVWIFLLIFADIKQKKENLQ